MFTGNMLLISQLNLKGQYWQKIEKDTLNKMALFWVIFLCNIIPIDRNSGAGWVVGELLRRSLNNSSSILYFCVLVSLGCIFGRMQRSRSVSTLVKYQAIYSFQHKLNEYLKNFNNIYVDKFHIYCAITECRSLG